MRALIQRTTRLASHSKSVGNLHIRLQSDAFYRVGHAANNDSTTLESDTIPMIIPQVLNPAIDVQSLRPGETIDIPYEVTLSHGFRDLWHSAFYCHDRINTSTPFARSLGFQDQVMPFSLMLLLAGSMSHADQAKFITEYRNACYHWPVFAGDTLSKKFLIRKLQATSDNLSSKIVIECILKNQRGVTVFSCEKSMLFPKVHSSEVSLPRTVANEPNHFLEHIIKQAELLRSLGSHTFTPLREGQLVLHTLTRPLTASTSMQLSSMARLTHERVFNTEKYSQQELYVPAGIVLGLTCSIASRDLHEILYEELTQCSFPNVLHPNECVGALTYVDSYEEHVTGDIEAINIRTIGRESRRVEMYICCTLLHMISLVNTGIKSLDVVQVLKNRSFPLSVSHPFF